MHGHGETVHIPFPFDEEDLKGGTSRSFEICCMDAYVLHKIHKNDVFFQVVSVFLVASLRVLSRI